MPLPTRQRDRVPARAQWPAHCWDRRRRRRFFRRRDPCSILEGSPVSGPWCRSKRYPSQMMCVRIDDSKIMIHEITSREDLILQPVALRDRKEDRADNHSADGDDEAEGGEFADVAVVPQFPNGYGHNLRTRR